MKRVILLTALILLISSGYSFGDVPCMINYQGRLIQNNKPVNIPVDMEFKLYTQKTEGEPIKTISINNVPVHNGLFRVVLDLEGVNWAAGETIYLEVKAGTDTLTPREPIYAYPYAINTHLLEGHTTGHFLDVSGSTQTKKGGLNIEGNVGIGTTEPEATLQVNGTMKIFGGWVDMTVAAGGGAVQGPATTDGFVSAYSAAAQDGAVRGYQGKSSPNTLIIYDRFNTAGYVNRASITMPVPKGYYWKVTGATKVYWMPLGSQ